MSAVDLRCLRTRDVGGCFAFLPFLLAVDLVGLLHTTWEDPIDGVKTRSDLKKNRRRDGWCKSVPKMECAVPSLVHIVQTTAHALSCEERSQRWNALGWLRESMSD